MVKRGTTMVKGAATVIKEALLMETKNEITMEGNVDRVVTMEGKVIITWGKKAIIMIKGEISMV
eukprot:5829426-Ditylum_brightwellii.AAC.1